MSEKIYTTFQVADICNVRPTTVIKWANQNLIKTYTTPGGHRRVRRADLLDFLKQYNLPIPSELGPSLRRVMIVDDEKVIGTMLTRALRRESAGLEVEWFKDGVEALLAIGKQIPDLIILDVVMPVMDGVHVLRKLRSDPMTSGVKVIGITGKQLSADKMDFIRQHTDAFFFKPFTVKEIICKSMSLMNLQTTTKKMQ
jgi:excisionase family DNA binding protein